MWHKLPLIFIITHVAAVCGTSENASQHSEEIYFRCSSDCARCSADGCIKCFNLLLVDTEPRRCASKCPWGMIERWSADERFMGKVCLTSGNFTKYLISSCIVATIFIVSVAIFVIFYARRRQRRQSRRGPSQPRSAQRIASVQGQEVPLEIFQEQLEALKQHAAIFLEILNMVKNQLQYEASKGERKNTYLYITGDLYKLLILLNTTYMPIVPFQWPQMANWALKLLFKYNNTNIEEDAAEFLEDLLRDYKKGDNHSVPVALYSNSFRIFMERPPSYSLVEMDTVPLADPWSNRPLVRRESVWIEDETINRLRRPDELTTEL